MELWTNFEANVNLGLGFVAVDFSSVGMWERIRECRWIVSKDSVNFLVGGNTLEHINNNID